MPSMKSVGSRQRNRNISRSKKRTAWKKNRQFGDAYGGGAAFSRVQRSYIPDSQLPAPLPGHEGPQLIENKPHCDFFFPVSGQEVLDRIGELPPHHTEGLTHIWLRHQRPNQVRGYFGSYSYGPGYRAIVLNPWPRSLQWDLGPKPSKGWKKFALQYNATLKRRRGRWFATFSLKESRRFYLDDLILHEVGHHVDDRWRSPANVKQLEDFANQYAVNWARRLNHKNERENDRKNNRKKPKRQRGNGMNGERWSHLNRVIEMAYPGCKARFGSPLPPPHPSLTVSLRLVDQRGRDQSNTLWIRPDAIPSLTVDGFKRRIDRAKWPRRPAVRSGR